MIRALKAFLVQCWDEVQVIDEDRLNTIRAMRAADVMFDVNALFGARYIPPDSSYRRQIIQLGVELELPCHNPRDAR